MMTVQRL